MCIRDRDLGCGNGALTKKLSELGFKASGLDASPELLQIARKNYPELTFYQGDATEFELPGKVDVIFSNAVLHWIAKDKQPDLLRCVYHALNENGQFVFEFGGSQNNALTHEAVSYTHLIRQIKIHVKRGEIVTLIGPNGSGKSTILKSIIRQLGLVDGAVYLAGSPMCDMTEKEIATKMSVLMTERIRPELMTCEDAVSYTHLDVYKRQPMSPTQLIPPTSPGQVFAGDGRLRRRFSHTGHGPFRALIVSNLKWGGPCRGHCVFPAGRYQILHNFL